MMRLHLSLLVAALLVPSAATAETLAEAIQHTLNTNPDLRAAALGVRAANESDDQARAAYLPSIDLEAAYGQSERETNPAAGTPVTEELETRETAANITQPLYTGGRRGAQMRLARATISASEESARSVEQAILLSAVAAYMNVLRDEEIARLRAAHVTALDQQVYAARRRLEVGDISRTDLDQSAARAAGARGALALARANLEAARARYVEVLGGPPEALAWPEAPPRPPTLGEAASRGLADHPAIGEALAQEDAESARMRGEVSSLLPQVAVVGRISRGENVDFLGEERDDARVGVQVSVPLFEGGMALSRTRQSRYAREQARALTVARRREVEARIVAAWNAANASDEVLRAADQQVAATASAVQGAERERSHGMRTTIEVLNAQQEWQEAQIAAVRARTDVVVSSYTLLAAMGALNALAFRSVP